MKRFLSLFFVVILFVVGFSQQQSGVEAAVFTQPTIFVQDDEILFSWQLPAAEMTVVAGQTVVSMAGLDTIQEVGLPQLPTKSFLIALPNGANPELIVGQVDELKWPYSGNLAIVPQPAGAVFDAEGNAIGGGYEAAIPQEFTKPVAVLEEIGQMRGVRMARLTIYPVRPDGNVLHVVQDLDLTIQLNAPALLNNLSTPAETDSMTQMIRGSVINPSHVQKQSARLEMGVQAVDVNANTAVIEVDQVGITAVSYADLANIGFPVDSVDPQKLHLTRGDQEVALEWVGDGDAQFESNEQFLFYAQSWFSRWMNEDVYLLSEEATNGLRIASSPASPTGLVTGIGTRQQLIEENNIYFSGCYGCAFSMTGHDGDRWYWDDLRNPGQRTSNSYPISLSNVDSSQSAKITVWMFGISADKDVNPDHKVDVSLNGTFLGTVMWDGKTTVSETFTIPANVLQNNNTLQLLLPDIASNSAILFDAAQIEYTHGTTQLDASVQMQFKGQGTPHAYTISMATTQDVRVYDVTNSGIPLRLSGVQQLNANQIKFGDAVAGAHEYAVVTKDSINTPVIVRMATPLLTATSSGADYIIIAPTEFMPALTSLIALRQSQGLTVVVEDVQVIYDQFGYGRSNPDAIHEYLEYAYQNWIPKPEFVLLVGDGTSDPKQYKDDSKATWIPPYLVYVDPWLGEIAADNRFVTVDGTDILPDMAIGRLPVNSLAEAQVVTDKIVQYEVNPHFGDWNSKIMSVTDNEDYAGNFVQHSDTLINQFVADPWTATKNYYNPDPNATDAEKESLKSQTHTAVLSEWNQGRGLVMFTGHSSIHQWAGERIFHLDDVDSLNNSGRLPIVLQMTCFTSSFQEPFWDTLDEGLIRRENGGAVATWGSTGLGVATGHDALADGFLKTIITNGTPELGRATMAGKLDVMANAPAHVDLIDTFTLLGDPATRYDYDFWEGYAIYLPVILK